MNKLIFKISILLIAMTSISFSSCTKNDTTTNVINIVQQGNWRITLYNDSGTDELSHFTGYTFTFSNGVITAVKNSSTISGTYSSLTDDSQKKFVLNFGAVVPFDEINDDWHILEETATKIRLEDVSGGGSGTDLLTFEKN